MIDRKITFALIFAIAVESAGVFAWPGGAAERRREVEIRVAAQAETAERLARVEVQPEFATAQLDCAESKPAKR
ncbi:MAG: hypothetical protein QM773_17310 [Hyphomonadaceae bacterium]